MGNAKSHEKTDESKQTKSSKNKTGSSKDSTPASDPNATKKTVQQDEEVKIYRSYSSLAPQAREEDVRVKVYRKSALASDSFSSQTSSLPRTFGRSRSEMMNGNVSRTSSTLDRRNVRSYTTSSLQHRPSSRTSSSALIIGYKVTKSDFPDIDNVLKILKQFEKHLSSMLLEKFSALPAAEQLSLTLLAHRADNSETVVTLKDYLEDSKIPLDLLNSSEYRIAVPPALLSGIMHVREISDSSDESKTSLARDLVTAAIVEGINEISRIYEYQLVLLKENLYLRLLAEHAVDCVVSFLRSSHRCLERNSLIEAIVFGKRENSSAIPKQISVIIGMRELKWDLYEIFSSPGLRKDQLLFSDKLEDDDGFTPWLYLTAEDCNPMLYGYRGLVILWNRRHSVFEVSSRDLKKFGEEVEWDLDDFHQLYSPYRRLVGDNVVQKYCDCVKNNNMNIPFDKYVLKLQGESQTQNKIRPVYRQSDNSVLTEAGDVTLHNTDVIRIQPTRDRFDNRNTKPSLVNTAL